MLREKSNSKINFGPLQMAVDKTMPPKGQRFGRFVLELLIVPHYLHQKMESDHFGWNCRCSNFHFPELKEHVVYFGLKMRLNVYLDFRRSS